MVENKSYIILDGFIGSAMAAVLLVLHPAEHTAGPAAIVQFYEFPLPTKSNLPFSSLTCGHSEFYIECKLQTVGCHLCCPGFCPLHGKIRLSSDVKKPKAHSDIWDNFEWTLSIKSYTVLYGLIYGLIDI